MRKKKVWRYYCDFCKKSGCSAGHMNKHERICTANPNRVCGMCEMVEAEQKPLAELVAVFDGWTPPDFICDPDPELAARINTLEDLTEGCPACMLATARAVEATYPSDSPCFINVEFKRRREEMWDDRRHAEQEREKHCI